MRTTTFMRHTGAVIAPMALLALACGVTLVAQRRRRAVELTVQETAPAASPSPAPAPAPAPAAAAVGDPAIERFSIIEAGSSALLRVHATGIAKPAESVLVVDSGEQIELLTALPTPMAKG